MDPKVLAAGGTSGVECSDSCRPWGGGGGGGQLHAGERCGGSPLLFPSLFLAPTPLLQAAHAYLQRRVTLLKSVNLTPRSCQWGFRLRKRPLKASIASCEGLAARVCSSKVVAGASLL